MKVGDYLRDDSFERVAPDSVTEQRYVVNAAASEAVRKYTDSPEHFRLNRYAALVECDPESGGFFDLSSLPDDFDPKSPLPPNLPVSPRSTRFCFPFEIPERRRFIKVEGDKGERVTEGVYATENEMIVENAKTLVTKLMTIRVLLGVELLKTEGCWTNPPYREIDGAVSAMKKALDALKFSHDGIRIVMSPFRARQTEYKGPVSRVTDERNPNRRYGLPPTLCGQELVVENTVVVRERKLDDPPGPKQFRTYVWPKEFVAVIYQHGPTEGENFSTLQYRMYERRVEVKAANNGGRVVEKYRTIFANPQLFFPVPLE